jgi:peptide deformylase
MAIRPACQPAQLAIRRLRGENISPGSGETTTGPPEIRLQILYYPDPILLARAAPIVTLDDEVRRKAREMLPLMALEKGIGLAAPQVGWGVRLLLAQSDSEKPVSFLVNPEITRKSGSEWGEEGCLSFPGIWGDVLRAKKVWVTALDLDGKRLEFEAEDLYARVLQHEIDHLDGILFVSKMRPADRSQNKKKLDDLKRKFESPPLGPVTAG